VPGAIGGTGSLLAAADAVLVADQALASRGVDRLLRTEEEGLDEVALGLRAGLAIVAVAVLLDRVSSGALQRNRRRVA